MIDLGRLIDRFLMRGNDLEMIRALIVHTLAERIQDSATNHKVIKILMNGLLL